MPCPIIAELAHTLDRPELFALRFDEHDRFVSWILVLASVTGREQTIGATYGQGLSFIRIAIHMVEWSSRAGYDVRYAGVVHAHRDQLSPIGSFVEALGEEPGKHRLVRFRISTNPL